MKQFAILMFCLLTGFTAATAQNKVTGQAENEAARAATQKLVAKYTLDADQAKQMYTIQARKLRNQGEIAGLKTSNAALYRRKVENLQTGTLNSIRRILHSKEQVKLFEKTQTETRSARADKRKEMSVKGASKDAIEDAMLDIYAE